MTILINRDELDPRVIAGGCLVGILSTVEPDILALNEGWFSDPLENIREIPRNPDMLCAFLADMLGPASQDPPAGEYAWHAISENGQPTGISLLLSADQQATPKHIGVGFRHQYRRDEIKVTGYVCLPLIALMADDFPAFVMGKSPSPIEVAVEIEASFLARSITFNAFKIEGSICFDGTAPALKASFLDEAGDPVEVVQQLKELLDGSATDLINAALAQPYILSWLCANFGTSEQTVGKILENFVSFIMFLE